jgi:hypothetical protein
MDLTIALQRAVRGFEHGTAALAARMGLQLTSLYHKVSPTYPTSHCSPEEMLEIMQITGDHGALHALAGHLGYVLLPTPDLAADTPSTLALAESVREFGEFAAESARSLADGRISDNELARIEREGAQALGAIEQLLKVAARVHQAGRPDAPAGLQRVA